MGGKVLKLKGEKFINRIAMASIEEGVEIGTLQGEVRGIIGRGYRRGSGIESDMNDISTQYGISPENVERLYAVYRPGRISAEESKVYDEVLRESGLLNQDGTLAKDLDRKLGSAGAPGKQPDTDQICNTTTGL